MASSKKSKPDTINIEDLIDDEATVEDFEEYNQIYPDLDAVPKMRNHCTSCFKHLGLSLAAVPKIRLHNVLKVTICKTCHEFYNSGEFERGEDGSELFCRWCGQGGVVFCCTKCIYVFCKECIRRNLGNSTYKKIINDNKWSCFRCDSNQLINLRARHHVFTNYLLNRQNHVNSTARNATELKEMLLEDVSTCCRSVVTTKDATDKVEEKEAPAANNKQPKKTIPQAGPSKAAPIVTPLPVQKRVREVSPTSMPGPLSKKLKKIADTPKPSKPAPQPKQTSKPSSREEVENDEPDWSLLSPIVELEVQNNGVDEELNSIDPLQMDTYTPPQAPPPARQPAVQPPLNGCWREPAPRPVPNVAMNPSPVYNPVPPEPESFHFGGHFMAMDSEPPPPMSMPRVSQTIPTHHIMRSNGLAQQLVLNRPPLPPRLAFTSRFSLNRPMVSMQNRPMAPMQMRPLAPLQSRPVMNTPEQDSVYHMVNGYRIDLKAAAEKQLLTLPDGKVIHVRRHITPTTTIPSSMPPSYPVIQRPPTSVINQMSVPANLQIRFQMQSPMNSLPVRGPAPRLATGIPVQRHTLNNDAVRPRRKTTLRERPGIIPSNIRMPKATFRPAEVVEGKKKLDAMVQSLGQSLAYAAHKCNMFKSTKVYKGAKSMEDLIELHTNFSYILSYATSGFKDITDSNEQCLVEMKSTRPTEKPGTEDDLQLLEDRPTCINLDSDEEEPSQPPPKKAATGIRCKTVSEINTSKTVSAGTSSPAKSLNSTEKAAETAKPDEITEMPEVAAEKGTKKKTRGDTDVINLDDSDDDEPDSANKIAREIIDEIIDALFGVAGGCGMGEMEDKENTPPMQTDDQGLVPNVSIVNDKLSPDTELEAEASEKSAQLNGTAAEETLDIVHVKPTPEKSSLAEVKLPEKVPCEDVLKENVAASDKSSVPLSEDKPAPVEQDPLTCTEVVSLDDSADDNEKRENDPFDMEVMDCDKHLDRDGTSPIVGEDIDPLEELDSLAKDGSVSDREKDEQTSDIDGEQEINKEISNAIQIVDLSDEYDGDETNVSTATKMGLENQEDPLLIESAAPEKGPKEGDQLDTDSSKVSQAIDVDSEPEDDGATERTPNAVSTTPKETGLGKGEDPLLVEPVAPNEVPPPAGESANNSPNVNKTINIDDEPQGDATEKTPNAVSTSPKETTLEKEEDPLLVESVALKVNQTINIDDEPPGDATEKTPIDDSANTEITTATETGQEKPEDPLLVKSVVPEEEIKEVTTPADELPNNISNVNQTIDVDAESECDGDKTETPIDVSASAETSSTTETGLENQDPGSNEVTPPPADDQNNNIPKVNEAIDADVKPSECDVEMKTESTADPTVVSNSSATDIVSPLTGESAASVNGPDGVTQSGCDQDPVEKPVSGSCEVLEGVKENIDTSIEDVISVLETISKEIEMKSDSEDGINTQVDK